MKTFYLIPILALTVSACTRIEAGHVGVKVNMLGGDKGDIEAVKVGRYWPAVNIEYHTFPTFEQTARWTKDPEKGDNAEEHIPQSIEFQTSQGVTVDADVGINYQVNPDKVVDLFQRYRRGLDEITDTFLRNEVRDAFVNFASKMTVEDVYGERKQELVESVEQQVRDSVAPNGIIVNQVYLLGAVRLPETVQKSVNLKIEATQRAQQRENELRETEAQAKKAEAEAKGAAARRIAEAEGEAQAIRLRAEAQAEANRIINQSLTPQLIEAQRIERWDGKLPTITSGNQGGILLNVTGK